MLPIALEKGKAAHGGPVKVGAAADRREGNLYGAEYDATLVLAMGGLRHLTLNQLAQGLDYNDVIHFLSKV